MSNPNSKEPRFGLPLPRLEANAVERLLGMTGLATGDTPGQPDGRVVIRFLRGWPEEDVVNGLLVPDFTGDYQRLIHGWSTRGREDDIVPARSNSGTSILYRYHDGEIRIDPLTTQGSGVRPDQLREAYHAITDFADLSPADLMPRNTDEGSYRVAESLQDEVLRGAAVCMLDQVAIYNAHSTGPERKAA